MAQVSRNERRRKRRARWLAQRLFRQMEQFDRFDVVLMNIDSILALIKEADVKHVSSFYDLGELKNKLRSYASQCETLAKRIDELLEKGAGTST
jgi:hypothetical protein